MDKYNILSKLGQGTYGSVYLCEEKSSGRQCVMKRMLLRNLSEKERSSALQEAQLLKSLNHPNIVSYVDTICTRSKLYLLMQFCDGGDLERKLNQVRKERGTVPEPQLLDWFVQMALALQYLHSKRILHRDLKTANVFLTAIGIVKLGDFGVSRVLSATTELAKTFVGTPYYLSPELLNNSPYGHASDVWALGVIFYEMCTLAHPYEAKTFPALAQKILHDPPPLISPLRPEGNVAALERLSAAMLCKDSTTRPSLPELLEHEVVQARMQAFVEEAQLAAAPQRATQGRPSLGSAESIASVSDDSAYSPHPESSQAGYYSQPDSSSPYSQHDSSPSYSQQELAAAARASGGGRAAFADERASEPPHGRIGAQRGVAPEDVARAPIDSSLPAGAATPFKRGSRRKVNNSAAWTPAAAAGAHAGGGTLPSFPSGMGASSLSADASSGVSAAALGARPMTADERLREIDRKQRELQAQMAHLQAAKARMELEGSTGGEEPAPADEAAYDGPLAGGSMPRDAQIGRTRSGEWGNEPGGGEGAAAAGSPEATELASSGSLGVASASEMSPPNVAEGEAFLFEPSAEEVQRSLSEWNLCFAGGVQPPKLGREPSAGEFAGGASSNTAGRRCAEGAEQPRAASPPLEATLRDVALAPCGSYTSVVETEYEDDFESDEESCVEAASGVEEDVASVLRRLSLGAAIDASETLAASSGRFGSFAAGQSLLELEATVRASDVIYIYIYIHTYIYMYMYIYI